MNRRDNRGSIVREVSCLVIDDSFKVRESELIKRINPSYFDSIFDYRFRFVVLHSYLCD